MRYGDTYASQEQAAEILAARATGQCLIKHGATERWLRNVWQTDFHHLRSAIVEHVESGKRVMRKTKEGENVVLPDVYWASVTLAEGLDVYVEMKLVRRLVIIIGAHPHDPSSR